MARPPKHGVPATERMHIRLVPEAAKKAKRLKIDIAAIVNAILLELPDIGNAS